MIATRVKRVRSAWAAGVVLLAVLTGCASGDGNEGNDVPNQDLFAEAKSVNLTFKQAVAEVQLQVLDDAWRIDRYGDIPFDCDNDNGYSFDLGRLTPEGWRIEGTALDAAEELGAWMETNGWSEVALRTYENGIDNVVVTATRPDSYVEKITVDIAPGEAMDGVMITAESTCEPGSGDELMKALIPGYPQPEISERQRPDSEHPNDTPIFGFNEDGTPL